MILDDTYLRELTHFFWENDKNPDEGTLSRLTHYTRMLVEKNKDLNLISRKDIENVVENHIFISAFITNFIPERASAFLDIGTGAGLPGIPFAILRPDLPGVLVDSISKKTNAVREFVEKLMLRNVMVENSRVEALDFVKKYAGKFDIIISRATVDILTLVRYSLPLIKEKAALLLLKGGDIDEEFRVAREKYGYMFKRSTIYELKYKPTNTKNEKGKKLVYLELYK
ncbi:MAG: 16S rRNA (guanine(527)-N(7))-methyltransferase RsmG [Ignavibacteriales bacterium]|nr:MAG: 16S rRNA (guanine(527)-N(7))-methyltransferase RsmG [Ignavibacteriaceae bacterium]MBW7873695.1 16S rRNA (guanine(527)-N(7))-methyltransferase RsmG [Ignavibacteria bacterium]MCZ2143920.1 16S rRNA (guanine(527)-N(7))-methyltransferase RsmG [Ignavibacteriales bacterium]OQY73605.1 MAG: 16S rRNA (guanine(527)-N(7))-methyltransferase RsmG [Ignavibacteriales bacterium UTCHB3]MBV6444597.1 Ribosomal RNA small subunit methyltransferase G [Ignavibacteriaceae bacterium]